MANSGEGRADDDGFESLYRQHARFLAYFTSRFLDSPADVDDIVQDVFLLAVRERIHGDPPQVRQWLKTVAARRALNRLRWLRLRNRLFLRREAAAEAIDPDADPETKMLVLQLHRVIQTLPARQRICWMLRHIEGESLDQVATICRCSLATAKREIRAAHETIRSVFADE